MTDPDWWSLIDRKAAIREQFPSADVVRATERVSLGNLHTPGPADIQRRLTVNEHRDAELFIARMEERTGLGAAYRARLAELSEARAVKRRELWMDRMRERGLLRQDQTA